MSDYVLDASALLALLNQETGADQVARALSGSGTVISAVNYAEVIARLAALDIQAEIILGALEPLGLEVRVLDKQLAEQAGLLVPFTRKFGLSLGDRSCLALAKQLNLPALTADQVWSQLDLGVKVEIIR